jgi:hypothetical protein
MALPGSSLPTRGGRRRKLLGWASVWPPGKGGKGVGEWLSAQNEEEFPFFYNSPFLFSVSKQNSYFDLSENSN